MRLGVKARQSAVQLSLSLARDFCCQGVVGSGLSIQSLGPQLGAGSLRSGELAGSG